MIIDRKSYEKLVKQDIEWLEDLMEKTSNENSLEGQHIIEVLKDSLKKYDDFWRYS